MSKRDYKEFASGEFFHVFNRGNNKADIFLESADYRLFLNRLQEYLFPHSAEGHLLQPQNGTERYQRKSLPPGSFSLISYCLMPNHFHLALRQNSELSISMLIQKLAGGYSKYFNKKYGRVGCLFQDQFKATHIESDRQLLHVSAYIHLNPVFAGLAAEPQKYPYSSYGAYVSEQKSNICEPHFILDQFANARDYVQFVSESTDTIRRNKELHRDMEH